MNAKEAREKVEKMNAAHTEKLKLQRATQHSDDVEHLYKHFQDKIEKEIEQRKFSVEMTLTDNMYSNEIISEVVNKLRKDGYQILKETHNAFKTIKFNISWV